MEQLSRTTLLLGEEAARRLSGAHVAVFGLGGVGGMAAEALARTGVGEITVVDADRYEESNLNRQAGAFRSTLGRFKTDVTEERLKDINPGIIVHKHTVFYEEGTAPSLPLGGFDAVADAIDSFNSKLLLITAALKEGVPAVSCMGTARKTEPELLRVSDIYATSVCPLAAKLRAALRKANVPALPVVWSPEPPVPVSNTPLPSAVFVPATAGLLLAKTIVDILIK